jgi:hypothetical protein
MLSPLSLYVRGVRNEKMWVPGWNGLWELAISKELTRRLVAFPSQQHSLSCQRCTIRCTQFVSGDDRYQSQVFVALVGFHDESDRMWTCPVSDHKFLVIRATISLPSRGWVANYSYSAVGAEAICAMYDKPGPTDEIIYGDYDELRERRDPACLNLPKPLRDACIMHVRDLCRQFVQPWLEQQYNDYRLVLDIALDCCIPLEILTLVTVHLLPPKPVASSSLMDTT